MREIELIHVVVVIFVVIIVSMVSYSVGLLHGHEANFDNCLKTNQHMVYTEAIKTCGGEVK